MTAPHYSRGGVGRADLLRALGALEAAGVDEAGVLAFAESAHFFRDHPITLPRVGRTLSASFSATANPVVTRDLPVAPTPLKASLFGIARVAVVAQEPPRPPEELVPLAPKQYLPRQTAPLPFAPLQTSARLARRSSSVLASGREGRAVDMGRAVELLARAQVPARWPRLIWPYAPAHIRLWIDRSPHLRPYWHDQDQLVYLLAQWLGENNLTTYTVQGDPWQPLACWSGGPLRSLAAPLASAPEDELVLVLSDMGHLVTGADTAGAVRWAQAMRVWAGRGARVLVCPPCSRELFSVPWPVAWFAQAQGGSQGTALRLSAHRTRAPSAPVSAVSAVAAVAPVSAVAAWQTDGRSAALERLLTLLACARRIEPALLRAVRNLEPGLAAEPGLEAQFWSCHAVLDIGLDVCVWRPGANLAYLQKFGSGPGDPASKITPALQQAVLRALLAIHAVRGQAIEVQELLTWASHVDAATASPFQSQIEAALVWLKSLPAGKNPLHDRNLISFAAQTVAFHGSDDAFMKKYADAIGPLWGMAYVDAVRHGHAPPAPGALPAGKLAQWCKGGGSGSQTRVYQLQQQQQQLSLIEAPFSARPGASPLGMTFSAGTLAFGRLAGGGQTQRFDEHRNALAAQERLGQALPEAAWVLQTETLALTLAAIEPPFRAVERGRDRYGMYADLEIIPEIWPVSSSEAETVAVVPKTPGLCVRFRYIEPGQFLMGSPETEAGRYDDEALHSVAISAGFWMLETACTQSLWQAVMEDNPSYFDEEKGGGPAYPVERVSWDDVRKFLVKLMARLQTSRVLQQDNGVLALPTEAEWEYACRAGTTTPFNFGTEINTDRVNYSGKFNWADKAPAAGNKERKHTMPARHFVANAWGLYQMHGNVFEWCADVWQDKLGAEGAAVAIDPGLAYALAPLAGGQKDRRVIRGGSWGSSARGARSACRGRDEAGTRRFNLGFRFVVRAGSQAGK